MKKGLLILPVLYLISYFSYSQQLSNKGKDFWVGYGATEKMYSDNSQDLQFTIYNPSNSSANVTISIPGLIAFTPLVYNIPSHSLITTNANEIPKGDVIDARLLYEGKNPAGIHIVGDQPVVVYVHDVSNSVYAASLLFPT